MCKSLSGADWHKVANKVEDGKSPFLMAIQAPKPPPGATDAQIEKYEKDKQSYILSPFIFHMNWLNSKYVKGGKTGLDILKWKKKVKNVVCRTLAPSNINNGLRPKNENDISRENIYFSLHHLHTGIS